MFYTKRWWVSLCELRIKIKIIIIKQTNPSFFSNVLKVKSID